jgi:hypothetical protein
MARPEGNLGLKQLIDLIYGLLLEKRGDFLKKKLLTPFSNVLWLLTLEYYRI